jgi:hypothetical protein
MAVAIGGAAIWALGSLLVCLSSALLSGPESLGTAHNLVTASSWLNFVAGFAALGAACYVTYTTFLKHLWSSVWELAGAVAATMIFVIGLLMIATSSNSNSDAGSIVSAVGLGGWAVLLLVNAARRTLIEQSNGAGVQRTAHLWFASAGALVAIAVARGLTASGNDSTVQIVAGRTIWFVGLVALISVLSVARRRKLISTKHFKVLIAGLSLIAVAELVEAIAAGVILSATSLTPFRVGFSIPPFVEAIAFVTLAWAALCRVGELSVLSHQAISPLQASVVPDTAASWKPDPGNVHELRWWDGTRWTEHVLDNMQPAVDIYRSNIAVDYDPKTG